MSNIPEARKLLDRALFELNIEHRDPTDFIVEAINLMIREKPIKIAKRAKKALTPNQIKRAKAWRKAGMQQTDIAARLNVNPGRISELRI